MNNYFACFIATDKRIEQYRSPQLFSKTFVGYAW